MEVLLRKSTLKQYNINECKERLNEILTEYIRVKYTYSNIRKQGEGFYNSSTTANYNLIMSNINYRDRIGDKIGFKIDNEIEAEKIQNDIEILYNKFTEKERDYFDYVLLKGDPQRLIEEKYMISKSGLEPIKQSCIIKSAMHFNIIN